MANTDNPNGFKPVKHLNGNPWNGVTQTCYIASTTTTPIFKYDLVTPDGTSDATGQYQGVTQSAASDTLILGAVVSFSTTPDIAADPTDHERDYAPGSTAMYCQVVTDPSVLYEAQEDSVGAAIAATGVSINYDITVGTGSTTTGHSAMEIDSSTATTATHNIKLIQLVDRPDNALGANAKWLCKINEHYHASTTGI